MFVRQAIDSVLSQTHPDWQLLVVDDGSEEKTREVVRSLLDSDPRCAFLEGPKPYPEARADACNRLVECVNIGLGQATGEIVHYLADDDFYDPGRFRAFDKLFSDPRVVVGYGRLLYVHRNGQAYGRTLYPGRVDDPRGALDHNQVAHRRCAMEKTGLWDKMDYKEYDPDGQFFRKLRKHWPFVGTDAVVAYKREHALNMQITKDRTGRVRE